MLKTSVTSHAEEKAARLNGASIRTAGHDLAQFLELSCLVPDGQLGLLMAQSCLDQIVRRAGLGLRQTHFAPDLDPFFPFFAPDLDPFFPLFAPDLDPFWFLLWDGGVTCRLLVELGLFDFLGNVA